MQDVSVEKWEWLVTHIALVVPNQSVGVNIDIAHKGLGRLLSSSFTVAEQNSLRKCGHCCFCISRLNERVSFEHAQCGTTGSKVNLSLSPCAHAQKPCDQLNIPVAINNNNVFP